METKILYTFDKVKRIIKIPPCINKCVFSDNDLEVDTRDIGTRIDIIINTFDFSSKIIKRDKHPLSAYTLLFEKLQEYKVDIANTYDINICYEPTEDEIEAIYYDNEPYYREIADEDDLIGFLRSESGEDIYHLENDDIIFNYRDDLIADIQREVVKHSPYYNQYKRLESYFNTLSIAYENDKAEREITNIIRSYKPIKEQQIENYFRCDNYEALKAILHRDIRSKRGKAVAMVLVALDMAGCKMVGDFTPLFDNILTPLYGVCGSRQGVTDQLSRIKETTESRDPKKAKLLKEMSEKYRLQLQ